MTHQLVWRLRGNADLVILCNYNYDSLEEYHHCIRRDVEADIDETDEESDDELMEIDDHQPVLISASGASIGALERTKYKTEDWKEVMSCSVCCEEFMTGEEITKMPCFSAHIFHMDCIQDWLKVSHTCPLCRYPMPTE
ncbi:hypothetical protein AQUCO_00700050v1 [Aquilegia coerulea]|uniref:RING-type domain-containing protein n=1 Tax=Aquilegia coerulea TaxID=218851 RepID=A0A2G5EIA0_AQUCA|nr:hypothetical protein AQUCO_00700050v1 [Aquilegia coerulea]